MPAYLPTSAFGIARNPRHTRGISASAATTNTMRHHTSGNAGREIIFPRIAVKPHRNTHRWICSQARWVALGSVGRVGMRLLSPRPGSANRRMSNDFLEYLRELFADLGPITTR